MEYYDNFKKWYAETISKVDWTPPCQEKIAYWAYEEGIRIAKKLQEKAQETKTQELDLNFNC